MSFDSRQQINLSDICSDVSYGYTESATSAPVGPKFLRITDIQGGTFDWNKVPFCPASNESLKKYRLEVGDIVVARTGNSTGENAQVMTVPPPAVFASYLIRFRPDASRVNPFFVGYQLRSERFRQHVLAVRGGSAQPGANAKQLGAFAVQLIPRVLQDASVEMLRSIDHRITLLRETNATLEAIAQALFKSWFVDFDPVRAKVEGRAPEGMDEATAALFPDALEETELGPVPTGWRYSTIGESFILTMGQSPPGDTYNEAGDGLPFYQGRTDFGFRFPSQRVFCTAPTRLAEPGDTLVSVRAPVGDVNMALEKCCVGRGVAAVRHPNGCRSFAFYATRGLRSRFDLFDSEGTVFGSINKKDFQALPVIEPSGDVLVAFDEIAAPIDRRIVGNEEQIRTLATLRDTLLPRLISGQLRVPEAIEATLA